MGKKEKKTLKYSPQTLRYGSEAPPRDTTPTFSPAAAVPPPWPRLGMRQRPAPLPERGRSAAEPASEG